MNLFAQRILLAVGAFALVVGACWWSGNYFFLDEAREQNVKLANTLKTKSEENAKWLFVQTNYKQYQDDAKKARDIYFTLHPRVEGDLSQFLSEANRGAKERKLSLDLIPSQQSLKTGINALPIKIQVLNLDKDSNAFSRGFGRLLSFSEWVANSRQLVTADEIVVEGNDSVGATKLTMSGHLHIDVPDEAIKNNALFKKD